MGKNTKKYNKNITIKDCSRLLTEKLNPCTADIDCKSTLEIVDTINKEDRGVIAAVARERKNIAWAVDLIVEALRNKGRLFYVGAGTSGRLGILDASECPPTFGTPPKLVKGIIAGGKKAVFRSVEGAEDNDKDGAKAVKDNKVKANDVVVGIATGGTTPFVHGALRKARAIGAKTIFLTCNPNTNPGTYVDVTLRPITGPEIIAGSTRMKGGTATKLILNTITTASMIKLGKVYKNLMVDLQVKNAKLADRAERIVTLVTGLTRDSVRKLLKEAKGHVKAAIVMHKLGLPLKEAKRHLAQHDGFLRRALED